MSINFPVSASNNQKYTQFKKNWRYNSTINAWRMEPISGSYIDDLLDVDLTGIADDSFLVLTGSTWVPKTFSGVYTGSFFRTSSLEVSVSESILTFTDNNSVDTDLILPSNLYSIFDTDENLWYFLDKDGIKISIASGSYAETASFAATAQTIDHYAFDNFVEGISLNSNQLYVSTSFGIEGEYEVTTYSASLSKFTNLQTVVGKSPNAAGDVTVALNTVITGTLASRPITSIDGDLYVIQNETGSSIGTNGTAFLYSEGPDDWFEVSPPTQEASDSRYAEVSGSTMLNNLRAFDVPIAGNEPATLAQTNAIVPTKDSNLRAFRIIPTFFLDPTFNTWVDVAYDQVDANDSGGTVTGGVYTVPATGVTRMTFTAGAAIANNQNTTGTTTFLRIVKNGTRILSQASHTNNNSTFAGWTTYKDEGINATTGLIQVSPGDEIKVQIKKGWRNRTKNFSPGTNNAGSDRQNKTGGSYFCGVVNDTPPGSGITNMLGGDGIEITGTVEVKSVSTDLTILRRDITNSITAGQTATGNITGTGSLVINGSLSAQNVAFSGSTFLTGDIQIDGLGNYVSDVEASANGVAVGKPYKNGNLVMIRIS